MSDDRLADLIQNAPKARASEDEPEHWPVPFSKFLADAIRAAVAADPSIVGMAKVVARCSNQMHDDWGPHDSYGYGCRRLWIAPSEGEATR